MISFCPRRLLPAALALTLLWGCATGTNPRDPLEPMNRAVYQFNDTVDRHVLKPVAQAYADVIPELVREGITNFFSNLGDVMIGANDLLQFKFYEAASDLMRVAMNTVFGLGGILDVATSAGLDKRTEDFGQTLGVWGVGSGPYLVLPFLGPSSLRDTAGFGVDYWFNPLAPVVKSAAPAAHWVSSYYELVVLYFVNGRANLLVAGNLIDMAAVDPYAFTRDAYLRRRVSLIYDGNPPPDSEDEGGGEDPGPQGDAGKGGFCIEGGVCLNLAQLVATGIPLAWLDEGFRMPAPVLAEGDVPRALSSEPARSVRMIQ